ncbi:hypothetical protein [Herpetosiphon geysericola]|uniref:Uncharacterized protein n=1 Tax=Herpetosiphon geysericola TaxID=70996 RepID=A0A0P6XZ43_9CHLR|nr:hypothetical protein [Herpetosiphon geysericola]KPL85270.1 hypothetical protein SE18_16440 [Herpetosiphon geysericola]
MTITLDQALEYLVLRLDKNASPELFAHIVEELVWLIDDNGADMHRIMRNWLDSDEIEKVKIALSLDEVFLLDSDEEYQATIRRIVERWPELAPMCHKFQLLWDLNKKVPKHSNRKGLPIQSLANWLPILAVYQHPDMQTAKDAF